MNPGKTTFAIWKVLITAARLAPALAAALAVAVAWGGVEQHQIDAPPPQSPIGPGGVWPSEPPADCPFKPSPTLTGLRFTGRHAGYTGADTWYPSWASDGNMYSPWTDGSVNGLGSFSGGKDASTGHAKIVGDDPLKLQIVEQGVYKSPPAPYEGRYPCGSLVYNGVWYYGTYCLHPAGTYSHDGTNYNWPWLGPFVGFRYSTDFGKTWTQTPCTPAKPLFGEAALRGEPVKIGSPHFVDFGKNLEHSPDGKSYLVAHGAVDGSHRRFAYNSWITGDQIYLIRVAPSIANINDVSKYEFFAGPANRPWVPGARPDARDKGLWTSDFSKIEPIAAWRDNMGCVTMTYDPPLKKYLMCITDGTTTFGYFNTYILESGQIVGPWKLVTYMRHFGEQAYFVNIPSKFIGGDGRKLWLCYAANFSSGWGGTTFRSRPPGSRYGLCLHEIELLAPGDQRAALPPLNPSSLFSADNVAPQAVVTATSTRPDYKPQGAVEGNVGGFPGDISEEWASNGEKDTAMLRLTWSQPQTIDRVWLFDRPNDVDQITSAMLVFSDGSTIKVGALPDDAKKGLEVKFDAKTVKWLALIVTGVGPKTQNIGLSKIAVFRAAK